MNRGFCSIVGAGPGDPGLITVKGLDRLRQAEVVFYDHLVSGEILAECPAEAVRIYVGKHRGAHAVPQEELCRRLCEAVQEGKRVVRLKGGDPFVLGRGGEEVQALAKAGLPFEVIPGVTSALASAACVGISVTQRHVAAAVTLVTGHEAPGKETAQVDWRALGALPHTLCIYMGMKHLRRICAELIAGGRSPGEPVAVIQRGTLPDQRCMTGTLADIVDQVEREGLTPPAIVVVGPVVDLRQQSL